MGIGTEFDKIEITADFDKRNCGDITGMGMN